MVAAELRRGGLERAFKPLTPADGGRFAQPSLTALNLGPLSDIESIGAGLVAALGVAVLGAFLVLERRREFAILRTVGADTGQVLAGPAQEGAIAVAGSVIVGVPLGLALSALSVRVLGLFFTLPPPLLSVPVGKLAVFVVAMTAASGIALAGALLAVNRAGPASVLREP
jgi:putative ABC transport system permease protein